VLPARVSLTPPALPAPLARAVPRHPMYARPSAVLRGTSEGRWPPSPRRRGPASARRRRLQRRSASPKPSAIHAKPTPLWSPPPGSARRAARPTPVHRAAHQHADHRTSRVPPPRLSPSHRGTALGTVTRAPRLTLPDSYPDERSNSPSLGRHPRPSRRPRRPSSTVRTTTPAPPPRSSTSVSPIPRRETSVTDPQARALEQFRSNRVLMRGRGVKLIDERPKGLRAPAGVCRKPIVDTRARIARPVGYSIPQPTSRSRSRSRSVCSRMICAASLSRCGGPVSGPSLAPRPGRSPPGSSWSWLTWARPASRSR
jgi:hypothetical protein